MPWPETDPVKERKKFILEVQGGLFSFAEACRRFGISRQKGYKWLERYELDGVDGLEDRSHRPLHCPHATPEYVLEAAFDLRWHKPRWGALKILERLATLHPEWRLPGERVLHRHLVRAGFVEKKKRSTTRPHPGRPTAPFDAPNAIWSADFKGQFKTLDGIYCYPLTVQDGFSRSLLGCQALLGPTHRDTRLVLTRLFREYGLPQRLRTDNGTPFASMALGRLSQISVWLIKLGVLPDLIEPGSPQQNARHERMHKDLKAETTIPPSANRRAQQRRFDTWRVEFNEIRPHESLANKTPASVYQPSPRPFPSKLAAPEYPDHLETRKVSTNGGIRWQSVWINVSQLLAGEYIGLEEIDNDVWAVSYGPVTLGWMHVHKAAILDSDGFTSRNPRRRALAPAALSRLGLHRLKEDYLNN